MHKETTVRLAVDSPSEIMEGGSGRESSKEAEEDQLRFHNQKNLSFHNEKKRYSQINSA